MARREQYIKSKTDFVLRKKHAVTNAGTIYENDHMTIVPDDGMYNEDMAMFSDSNFKFRIRNDYNEKKKHFAGNWVKPDGSDADEWTIDNCPASSVTKETRIQLKPNYSSMKDFVYYGSAEKLVEATIRDIILRYPGGICHLGSDKGRTFTVAEGEVTGVFHELSNEFDIDVWTSGATYDSVENPMRVLSASYDKYVAGTSNTKVPYVKITTYEGDCPRRIIAKTVIGHVNETIYTYLNDDGSRILVTKTARQEGTPIIRVPDDLFYEMYDKLDDFEKVLLNLETKPIFKASFDTPKFDGQGYFYSQEDYVWPKIGSPETGFFTPDLSSIRFDAYVARLIALAKYHDEHDSDNIWRMLTHTSIKNLDWTFRSERDGDVEDLTNFDTTRMKAALHLYGRQFDDLKRYADNVKYSNSITYDEKNNIPDYFLTDTVENDGWDAYHTGPSNDESIRTNVLYTGSTYSGVSSSEANIAFMRRLSLNSDYIQSLKGTRRGLEVIMSMFGMTSGTEVGCYTIHENVAVVGRFPKSYEMTSLLPYYDNYYYGDDILGDWPVVEVQLGGDDDSKNYLAPWYDKSKNYGFVYQSDGGWEMMTSKKINLPAEITSVTEITPTGDLDIYGETLQYMKYAADLYELTGLTTTELFNGVICYVEDITGLVDRYVPDNNDKEYLLSKGDESGSAFSHYFILKNSELSPHIGFVNNEFFSCYGWRNIFRGEFDGSETVTCDGMKVLYMESIKTTFIGNNPHVGYGFYDDGFTYLEHYRRLFKDEIENKEFSIVNDGSDIMDRVKNLGFGNCDMVEDNVKCHYFADTTESTQRTVDWRTDGSFDSGLSPIGEEDTDWREGLYEHLLIDPDEGITDKHDESAALSIINVKNMLIDFTIGGNEYLKDYIENVVLRYIEQMMPSTAIFRYTFDNSNITATPADYVNLLDADGFRATVEGVYAQCGNDIDYMGEWDLTRNNNGHHEEDWSLPYPPMSGRC